MTQITDLFTYQHGEGLIQTSSTLNVIHNTSKIFCFYTCFATAECCASSYNNISVICLIDRSQQWTTGYGGYLYAKSSSDIGSGMPKDCSMLPTGSCSGKYTIYPEGLRGVEVYCDMSTDGGNWTVFQKVKDSNVPFDLYWNDYRNGFGDPNGDFWLGNKYIYALTSQATYQLRIDFLDYNDVHRYAIYETFAIGDENDKYRLLLGNYIGGDAGDDLSPHNGAQFSTRDNDNDGLSGWNCAEGAKSGGFWYTNCYDVDLNGRRVYNSINVKRSVMIIRKV